MERERDFPPLSPGAALQERIVRRLGIGQAALAQALGVSRFTVSQLLDGRRGVTAEMALRLGHVLDTSPELWLKLQAQVDLFEARRAVGAEIGNLPRLRKATRSIVPTRRNRPPDVRRAGGRGYSDSIHLPVIQTGPGTRSCR